MNKKPVLYVVVPCYNEAITIAKVVDDFRRVLPDAEFRALQEDEKVWITQKESAVQAAGAEYEGGSMQPLVENSTAAKWTEDRVKYLINLIPRI